GLGYRDEAPAPGSDERPETDRPGRVRCSVRCGAIGPPFPGGYRLCPTGKTSSVHSRYPRTDEKRVRRAGSCPLWLPAAIEGAVKPCSGVGDAHRQAILCSATKRIDR